MIRTRGATSTRASSRTVGPQRIYRVPTPSGTPSGTPPPVGYIGNRFPTRRRAHPCAISHLVNRRIQST